MESRYPMATTKHMICVNSQIYRNLTNPPFVPLTYINKDQDMVLLEVFSQYFNVKTVWNTGA